MPRTTRPPRPTQGILVLTISRTDWELTQTLPQEARGPPYTFGHCDVISASERGWNLAWVSLKGAFLRHKGRDLPVWELSGPRVPLQSRPTEPSRDQRCLHTEPCNAVCSPPKIKECQSKALTSVTCARTALAPKRPPHVPRSSQPHQGRGCSRGAPGTLLVSALHTGRGPTDTHPQNISRQGTGPRIRTLQLCTWDVGQPQAPPTT